MIICNHIERADKRQSDHTPHSSGNGLLASEYVVDTVTLDETDRHRRRILLTSDSGIKFLLELVSATLLMHDDVLRLSDGRGIRVQALPEALYEIRGTDPMHLLTLTWHVGNRHLATQILADHVRIRHDTVIRTMLEQLGAEVTPIVAAFNPEGGAYGDVHSNHHVHGHEHGDKQTHAFEHRHANGQDDSSEHHDLQLVNSHHTHHNE